MRWWMALSANEDEGLQAVRWRSVCVGVMDGLMLVVVGGGVVVIAAYLGGLSSLFGALVFCGGECCVLGSEMDKVR